MTDKTTVTGELPELPTPDAIGVWGYMEPNTYSAKAMRAYATAALAQKDGEIAALKALLIEASKQTRHPDYDWPLDLQREVSAALGSQA